MNKVSNPIIRKHAVHVMRRCVQVGKMQVHYQEAGQGDAVVLVHGLSGSWRWWARNIPELAKRYHIYLVDLPGFGSMRRAGKDFQLPQAADWLLQWMEAVGIERAHLIGHSMGGYICLRLAAMHPEKVRRLVLISPAILQQPTTFLGYCIPLLLATKHSSPSFSLILWYDALRAGPRMLFRAARALLSQESLRNYNAIDAPTLLIWGDDDTLVPPLLGYVLQKEIRKAQLHIFKRAGHVSMFECAKAFNQRVIAFLDDPGL